ncbi:hypothetical protein COCC4DRAFT_122693 [Bipolaris maydis ATCC 48331]|uniref:Enoyl reductase (ER) domain-containing protein n=2 Tax=Cochliobolus heterostrophus TaxID=5016 RepID=M2V6G4_COCH5|nr:uncharacterized protein COCC4DRAFT_122693 [Bipolaris maydis ATCC 48331]EMD95617.1 hypothetical protein COCHEDRAFT_1026463 [Bipolaris maydis C5]ENI10478.1 hypothetical protein COCC4DRAFT_122693 [Bipolaris maydis ATCC 48331]KAJ6213578.1 chaperonin 10-like protein [Bipolaris maydis]KAJ6274799.1 chaperonin 10-like protein [Bipolaris maydis]
MATTTIPKKMLAWQKHSGSSVPHRVEVDVPQAPEDGLLVRIHAAGVCHSDIALLEVDPQPHNHLEKYTLGHEGCGEVVSVGSASRKFALGDIVAILSIPGCGKGTCPECTRGLEALCQTGERYGIGHDGSFAPYVAVRERAAVKLPAGLSPVLGAVVPDAVLTAYGATVERANIEQSDTVLLFGLGGLGFNALQIILGIGARVIVADKRQEVIDEAVKFGVKTEDVVPPGTNAAEFVTKNRLVIDKTVDFVGVSDTFKAAIDSVRIGGTVVVVGLINPNLSFDSRPAIIKAINVLFTFGGSYASLEAALELVAKEIVKPQVVTRGMDELPQALEDLHHGKVKSRVVLVPETVN